MKSRFSKIVYSIYHFATDLQKHSYLGIKKAANASQPLLEDDLLKMYYQQARCIVKQYDGYYEGQTLPPELKNFLKNMKDMKSEELGSGEISMGWLTLGENIADTTGMQSVLNAYKKMRSRKTPDGELKLPGFEEFTDEQMFFISFGGVCTITHLIIIYY